MSATTLASVASPKKWIPSPQELALAIITMLWGGTYYLIHLAVLYSGPLFFVGIRFLMAASFVFLVTGPKRMRGLTRHEARAGCLIGFALVTAYVLQTMGLKYIPSSRSAFITALYVPLVPILQWMVCRKPPSRATWLGVGCAFSGLMLISGVQGGGGSNPAPAFGFGEVLTVLATVAIAFEILFISMFSKGTDSRRLAIIELLFGSSLAFFGMFLIGEQAPVFAWGWFGCALALALLSAGVQLIMNWAQQTVSATQATLIYASEPIWGGIAGKIMGEALPPLTIVGAFFIVIGVVLSEMRPDWNNFRRMFRGAAVRPVPPKKNYRLNLSSVMKSCRRRQTPALQATEKGISDEFDG